MSCSGQLKKVRNTIRFLASCHILWKASRFHKCNHHSSSCTRSCGWGGLWAKAGENRQKSGEKVPPSDPTLHPTLPHTPNPSSDPTRSCTPYHHHQEPQGIGNLSSTISGYHFIPLVSPHQLISNQHLIRSLVSQSPSDQQGE